MIKNDCDTFKNDFRIAKLLDDDYDLDSLHTPGTYNVYTTINEKKYRWILVVDWCNASGVGLPRQTAYYYMGGLPIAPLRRYVCQTNSGLAWSQWF